MDTYFKLSNKYMDIPAFHYFLSAIIFRVGSFIYCHTLETRWSISNTSDYTSLTGGHMILLPRGTKMAVEVVEFCCFLFYQKRRTNELAKILIVFNLEVLLTA